ncbi:hypothetical protein FRC20_011572 [Serendipita sp. 405]|nr:hypothetical protein FRC20_011572 [Serendipita sp. 405]
MASYEKAPSTPLTAQHSSFLKEDLEGQDPVESLSRDEKAADDPHGTTSTPKYTLKWWKETWSDSIRDGKWPRVFYTVLGVVFIVGWVGIMLGLVGTEVNYEKENSKGMRHRADNHNSPANNGELDGLIMLKGSLVNFNIEKRALTVTWSGLYLNNSNAEPVDLGNPEDENTWYPDGIEIYRDLSSGPYNASYVWDNDTYWEWAYRIDNATAKPAGVIGMHPWDSFDTDITFTQRYQKNAWAQPLLGYPLDQWQGQIVFVASNLYWSKIYKTNGSAIMDIAGVQLADSTLNWRFDYEYKDACGPAEVTINWDTDDVNTLPHDCHMTVNFIGRRPPLLIFCAIAAVAVNWTCAIFIFILTCEAIIMRRSYMLQGTDILSMCFTALFALPTIRSLLPGAPAYGAIIDLVGILPCTLIVALCAVCVSVAKLNKRYRNQKSE